MQSTINELRKVIALSDLPEEHLQWLAERVESTEYEDGEVAVRKGDPVDSMMFLAEGSFAFYMDVGGQQVFYHNFQNDSTTGGVSGLLPYSRMKESPGYAYSTGKSRFYWLHKKYFQELEQLNPDFIQRLIGYMTERARDFATKKLQHEKVSALGRLAAGIAHELNNPASAINRIASELSKRLKQNYKLTEQLLRHRISPDQIDNMNTMVEERENSANVKLTPLERMQKEDEITDWLRRRVDSESSIASETCVDAGITCEDLEDLMNGIDKQTLIYVLKWADNLLISNRVIKDLEEASLRITNLVSAVKSHVHMDQTNELVPTDINRDIENSLTLMGYKLREKNITVVKIFSDDLPEVPVYVGELNQVWTNIIDNAIYALEQNGELTIETSSDGKNAYVKIIDNGAGIPPEIISRIFDPFFTTKKVGEGTGIGLDLVKRIIDHHNGEIKVHSAPGRTEFIVCIPYQETKGVKD
jgi:signal transduction histidine kinase